MIESRNVTTPSQLVDGPPSKDFAGGKRGIVREALVLIGWIDAPREQRAYLSDLGVEMRWAEYRSTSERWGRCLFSEEVADLLEDLHSTGDFPCGFEAGPSEGKWPGPRPRFGARRKGR